MAYLHGAYIYRVTIAKDWGKNKKCYKYFPLGNDIMNFFFHFGLFSDFKGYLLF